jgi:membrane dipeptidase
MVIDGHNDVLSHLHDQGAADDALLHDGTATITVPSARAGGLAAGLFAVLPPAAHLIVERTAGGYEIPYAPSVEFDEAVRTVGALVARLLRADGVRIVRDAADLDACLAGDGLGAILHMEGAEAIDPELAMLEVWYAVGLRSLGPVWSRPNIFGHGVPFAYPSSPDTGPGLTDAGKRLVKACNRLGVMVDLAHITEQGFWDVARLSDQPLAVSHSNVHAITPVARNLTDRQLDAVRESRGVVGLNFAVGMLRVDGVEDNDTPISQMVRHIDHLVDKLGIDGVALGSDFDGAPIPVEIGDAAGLQKLVAALRSAGYGEDDLAKICRENWLRVLGSAWHEDTAS